MLDPRSYKKVCREKRGFQKASPLGQLLPRGPGIQTLKPGPVESLDRGQTGFLPASGEQLKCAEPALPR